MPLLPCKSSIYVAEKNSLSLSGSQLYWAWFVPPLPTNKIGTQMVGMGGLLYHVTNFDWFPRIGSKRVFHTLMGSSRWTSWVSMIGQTGQNCRTLANYTSGSLLGSAPHAIRVSCYTGHKSLGKNLSIGVQFGPFLKYDHHNGRLSTPIWGEGWPMRPKSGPIWPSSVRDGIISATHIYKLLENKSIQRSLIGQSCKLSFMSA